MIKRLLILLALLLFASVGWATDYYVRSDADGGNNGLTNTSTGAWTWQEIKDNATVAPNDTIYFYGNFTPDLNDAADRLSFAVDGTAGNPIVYDGTNATVTMANVVAAEKVFLFTFNGDDYITIQNFSDVTTGASPGYQITIGYCNNSTNGVIDNNNFSGDFQAGFYGMQGGCDDWTFSNNIFEQTSVVSTYFHTGYSGDAIRVIDGSNYTINNNRFSNWGHAAVTCDAGDGAAGDCDNWNVYYNYFSTPDNDTMGQYPFGAQEAGTATDNVSNIYFHHNFIDGSRARIGFDGGDGIYMYGNIIKEVKNCCDDLDDIDTGCDAASTVDTCSDFEGYYKTGYGLYFRGDNNNVYLWNNTWHQIAEACIFFKTTADGVTDNIELYNNVLSECAMTSALGSSPIGSTENGQDYAFNYRNTDSGPPTNVTLSNNLFNTDTDTDARGDTEWGGTARTISAFDTAYAWSSGNLSDDPGFVSGELWPDTGSAMIATGTALSGSPYSDGGPGGAAVPLYNYVIDPDETDFTTTPPTVVLEGQPTSWYIGAYGESAIPTGALNGVSLQGVKLN